MTFPRIYPVMWIHVVYPDINLSFFSKVLNFNFNIIALCSGVLRYSLQWRHNECHGVSNHRCIDFLFRRRSKKTSKLHVTGHWEGFRKSNNFLYLNQLIHYSRYSYYRVFSAHSCWNPVHISINLTCLKNASIFLYISLVDMDDVILSMKVIEIDRKGATFQQCCAWWWLCTRWCQGPLLLTWVNFDPSMVE